MTKAPAFPTAVDPAPAPPVAPPPDPSPDAVTVLVVDDERSNIESLEKIFLREGIRVLSASDAKRALELVRTHRVHVVLTDLMMPGTTGLELLRAIRQVAPDVEVVLMTAYGSVEAAVSAMRDGAYDFVEKPLKRVSIVKSVRKAAERQKLVAENKSLKDEIKRLAHREIVGSSPALRRVIDVATQAAPSQATVLVLGESGTGKELLARYIHERSARARGPFVAVNCAAIPETILEAELFGHEKGAFTGAHRRTRGWFEQANGGTLFLDEIASLSPEVQAKLLRVLQDGRFQRMGGEEWIRVDVHLLSAANQDLRKQMGAGQFREDLYYRLGAILVQIPSLRERSDDVPALLRHFLARWAAKYQKSLRGFTHAAWEFLVAYPWPGNVRQMEHVVETLVAMEEGSEIDLNHFPAEILAIGHPDSDADSVTRSAAEHRKILDALAETGWNRSKAAILLGISRPTLRSRMNAFGITPGSVRSEPGPMIQAVPGAD